MLIESHYLKYQVIIHSHDMHTWFKIHKSVGQLVRKYLN